MVYEDEVTTKLFKRYSQGHVDFKLLDDKLIDHSFGVLKSKAIKDASLHKFREQIKTEHRQRRVIIDRIERIEKNVLPVMKHKVACSYELTFALHRILLQKEMDQLPLDYIDDCTRNYGRCVGLSLYDLPSIQTGLYSVDALRNINTNKNKSDKASNNTNEHFFSLYANAGPHILNEAIKDSIEDPYNPFAYNTFVWIISRLCQTIKTTLDENNRLLQFHTYSPMINVQNSYEQSNVSPLVDCGINTSTEIYLKWQLMCESIGEQFEIVAGDYFNKVLTLEEALSEFPELRGVERYISTK